MSNSSLVDYTKWSPHTRYVVNKVNRKITVHHMAGNLTVEACGNAFNTARVASSQYGIGTDGRVGQYVDENARAITSSSTSNDSQAVTIEVANDTIGGNWHVSDRAFDKLIKLCVDICKRNGIDKLVWTGDSSGNLTTHNMFAATGCPGPYLYAKMPELAQRVNAELNPEVKPKPKQPLERYESSLGVPMYRMYNENNGEHFYAACYDEANNLYELGWHYEGISFIAPFEGAPLYRLYNRMSGLHHYTTSETEADNLINLGWTDEGIACRVGGDVPIYRVYNPQDGNHHYTKYKEEAEHLVSLGWRDEGLGWYAVL